MVLQQFEAEKHIYDVLTSDATLKVATYLTSGCHYFLTPSRPADLSNPMVTFDYIPSGTTGQNFDMTQYIVRVRIYLDNLTNNSPDTARFERIFNRIQLLLHDKKGLTGAAGVTYLQTTILSGGRVIPMDDASKSEHVGIIDFSCTAVKE